MKYRLDCRDMQCPQPLLLTKQRLEDIEIHDTVDIVVNSLAPFENIKRFLQSCGFDFSFKKDGEDTIFSVVKNVEIPKLNTESFCDTKPKVIYLNEQSAGSGLVGKSLLSKLLGSILSIEKCYRPQKIICVNEAVFMTTDRTHPCFEILKKLEQEIQIISCGSCLESYKLVDKLSIGVIGNAYEIVEILLKSDVVKL